MRAGRDASGSQLMHSNFESSIDVRARGEVSHKKYECHVDCRATEGLIIELTLPVQVSSNSSLSAAHCGGCCVCGSCCGCLWFPMAVGGAFPPLAS